MFRRLLIANRGTAAVRVLRACDVLGVAPVLAVSEADRDAPYARGREVVVIGPAAAARSYLDAERVVQAAKQKRCSALHPGWGFLSQSPLLATLCEVHGVTFIGPPAAVMQRMGNKILAKQSMAAAGVEVIPGSDGVVTDFAAAGALAERFGYPVLVKAQSGGGGRGMRLAHNAAELQTALGDAAAEARAAFGDPGVYLEKCIEGGRHVELQIFGDRYGNAVQLGERDCSVQRQHQKLIEESPAPTVSDAARAQAASATVEAMRRIGYVGAGTVEFLVGADGVWRFMEMNTRLQVEHGVTEMRCGVDLVTEQLRVAAGHRLSWSQDDIRGTGHVIECRINAEDPADGFRPQPGRIERWVSPRAVAGELRVETHVESGYEVPPYYDSLLCKVIAAGVDRPAAVQRMLQALDELVCEGIATTLPLHRALLQSEDFRSCRYDTRAIPGWSQ